jgi:hypothetical protein
MFWQGWWSGNYVWGMLAAAQARRGARELRAGWSAKKSVDQTWPITLNEFNRCWFYAA